MLEPHCIAVIGATGAVGRTMAAVLEERRFAISQYIPVATEGSNRRRIDAFGRAWAVCSAGEVDFSAVDVALFTAGATVSREIVPKALSCGCRVVDNTTAFRMDAEVPLVVPEINAGRIGADTRLVSCPNCTAIVLVMSLWPLVQNVGVKRVVVTSFQSVSGAGRDALDELDAQLRDETAPPVTFPKRIAYNCIPRIGPVQQSGYSLEEEKIIDETRKILDRREIDVVPTTVRVPVQVGHGVSVNVELEKALTVTDAVEFWRAMPGVAVSDEPPTPLDVAGTDAIMVGHVRSDPSRHALSYWAVGDNLRKGAATNSVQIAEILCR